VDRRGSIRARRHAAEWRCDPEASESNLENALEEFESLRRRPQVGRITLWSAGWQTTPCQRRVAVLWTFGLNCRETVAQNHGGEKKFYPPGDWRAIRESLEHAPTEGFFWLTQAFKNNFNTAATSRLFSQIQSKTTWRQAASDLVDRLSGHLRFRAPWTRRVRSVKSDLRRNLDSKIDPFTLGKRRRVLVSNCGSIPTTLTDWKPRGYSTVGQHLSMPSMSCGNVRMSEFHEDLNRGIACTLKSDA